MMDDLRYGFARAVFVGVMLGMLLIALRVGLHV